MSGPGVPARFQTNTLREVQKPGDFPLGSAFVIQFYAEESICHEGDERSRTCPGHGYPAYTEQRLSVRQFVTANEAEWIEALTALYCAHPGRTDVVAFRIVGAEVKIEIRVGVG